MANYLITGGTGLIGSALIQRLTQSPSNITVLTRDKKKVAQTLGYTINAVESFEEIPENANIEFVINLAGEPIADKRWSMEQKMAIWQSRVELTSRLVKWIESTSTKPKVLLSGSAVGWYGDGGSKPLTEESPPHDEYTHKLCDAWEKAAQAAEQSGVRVCLLRTGLVISPYGGFLKKMILPAKLGLSARLGDGKQYMPWIHIDDMVNAILLLLDPSEEDVSSCHGAFNMTAPAPVSNDQFTQTLARQLNKPCFLVAPAFVLNLLLGEMARLLLTGQNAVPAKLQSLGFQFRFEDIHSALQNVLDE